MRFQDKIALVTGGSKGLGKVIAKELAQRGCTVAICSQDAQALSAAVKEISELGGTAHAFQANLTEMDHIDQLHNDICKQFGRIDILVNNVGGIRKFKPFMDISDHEWQAMFELNFFATMRVIRAFIPVMQQQGSGRIINISSEVGVQPEPLAQHYCAAKAAINNLTKSLSLAYGKQGILINAVSPAFIMTSEIEQLIAQVAKKEERTFESVVTGLMNHQHRSKHALDRPAKPEEVAALVVFLASDLASYINGSNFKVDGGSVATL